VRHATVPRTIKGPAHHASVALDTFGYNGSTHRAFIRGLMSVEPLHLDQNQIFKKCRFAGVPTNATVVLRRSVRSAGSHRAHWQA